MKETERANEEILADLLSGDAHRIWQGANDVVSLGQDRERIRFFIPHLPEILRRTQDAELGGALLPNRRFVELAAKTIRFHAAGGGCPCGLYPLPGEDTVFSPHEQQKLGNAAIVQRVYYPRSDWVDYYIVECTRCRRQYRVIERASHYFWWKWTPLDDC